jgi:hypothetical protein
MEVCRLTSTGPVETTPHLLRQATDRTTRTTRTDQHTQATALHVDAES